MILKKYIAFTVLLFPMPFPMQFPNESKEDSSDSWWEQCKPIHDLFDKISKSGQYNLASIRNIRKKTIELQRCTDGYYGQGIADIVAKSLAVDFTNIAALASSDNGLADFVYEHINATADWDDLDKIVSKTKSACPPKANNFCKRVADLSTNASKEAKEL